MKVEYSINKIITLPDEYDFNWVELSFWDLHNGESGSEFSADVEVKIPKTIRNVDEIKKHALHQGERFFTHCAELIGNELGKL